MCRHLHDRSIAYSRVLLLVHRRQLIGDFVATRSTTKQSCKHRRTAFQLGLLKKDMMENPVEVTGRSKSKECKIVYVLGGPASGKGTQCPKIAARFGFCHISVGELLDKEVASGSKNGDMIKSFKLEGKLLPAEMVVKLLQQAIEESEMSKFLIDGFPRSLENLAAAEKLMKIEPEFVLYLDCSEEEMISRLLNRNQGRADDNIVTIPKRIKVFLESTLPVIDYYTSKEKVFKVNGEQSKEDVFKEIESLFCQFESKSGAK